eukprot:TRINITY_DN391_c0_g1_i5.p1 TRINITY_DN391_c0_g1~~TRINITY_DN391_c0_g1_i5.p1  ORF type:complete len:515 (-),score=110.26 TRINITY_DN391_c0_g1_i5:660-2204(-)
MWGARRVWGACRWCCSSFVRLLSRRWPSVASSCGVSPTDRATLSSKPGLPPKHLTPLLTCLPPHRATQSTCSLLLSHCGSWYVCLFSSVLTLLGFARPFPLLLRRYSPAGQSRLREVFMKTDNLLGGRYLAEITHELFMDLRDTKYQNSEPRLSIYGRSADEWAKLAAWAVNHKIYSDNVRWLIQVPRLYSVYRKLGTVESFQTLLDNIFTPLFEATLDPQAHAPIAHFLQQVVGFDSVDDESVPTPRLDLRRAPPPAQWTGAADPPFEYQAYYLATNLSVLNRLRESRGLNTFTYRPHAGEAGEVDHLGACFLLSHGINHGINLRRAPVLQHLYYLTQVGIAMSPISNNALFLEYLRNPFIAFFRRGLNVSLSTDDPLQLAMTKEPLMEEFAVAAQVWKLTSTDLCELARNSVIQSGFESCVKAHWDWGAVVGPGRARQRYGQNQRAPHPRAVPVRHARRGAVDGVRGGGADQRALPADARVAVGGAPGGREAGGGSTDVRGAARVGWLEQPG